MSDLLDVIQKKKKKKMECGQATFRCKLATVSVYICSNWLEDDLKVDLIIASESCSPLCF